MSNAQRLIEDAKSFESLGFANVAKELRRRAEALKASGEK